MTTCGGGTTEARDRTRLAAVEGLLQSVRSKEFRDAIAETTREGERVVSVALSDDTMASLFDQVRSVHGPVHVAVQQGDGYDIFVMEPYAEPRHSRMQSKPSDHCPISPHTQVGMVLAYLRARGAPIFCYEASPTVAFKLVEDEDRADTLV